MLLKADGKERLAFATVGRDGVIVCADVCDSEREALELRRQMTIRQPHRACHGVVAVTITMKMVDD